MITGPFDIAMMAQTSPQLLLNPYKLGSVVLLFVGWAFAFQWMDRDTDVVKTRRERWNLIVLGGAVAGLALLLIPPVWAGSAFFLGLGFWLLLGFGSLLIYVFHRNGRVVPDSRVLTPGHVKRLMANEGTVKAKKADRGQRIHLADHEGNDVERPQDRELHDQYAAAQDFLFDVLWRRASDVDVVRGKDNVRVLYKIDGVTSERPDVLTSEDAERVFQYLKELAGLNPAEIRRPQEGHIYAAHLAATGDLGRVQVITSGSTIGERLRLRIQQPTAKKRLKDLGFSSARLEQVKQIIDAPKGLVVISGPRQSGVTTTQYAILREHDAFMRNIHALEKKPLYDLDNVTQARHEGKAEGVSYARHLQSVLRREPDIVGIGETDDRETAQIALRAAADDRKIYLAMEGKSTFDALSRLMSFAEDNQLVASALLGVLNQRLIRLLCPSCRQSFRPDEQLLRKANIPPDKVEHFHRPPTEPVFDRKGREIICQTCQGSGYVGRTAVFEVLVADDKIHELISQGAPVKQIRSQARKNKMLYMQEEGLLKVIDGTTSLDEIIRGLRDDSK